MEETKDLITFIVLASSAIVVLLVVVLFDLIVIFRKRMVIARQEMIIKENKIDELLMTQEIEAVNAMLQGQHNERRRISQDLHDRLGGILFAAKLYNRTMSQKIKEIQLEQKAEFEKLSALLDEAVTEVRRISHDLYHSSLAAFGYPVALNQLIRAIEAANEVQIQLDITGEVDRLDAIKQQELYAITQEMLSNTLKHAAATQVHIFMQVQDATTAFSYSDNGRGFEPKDQTNGIGLESIRQRTEKMGATFSLESAPGQGTKYYISIPNG
jgi:signal transduction histidine kinase